MEHYDLPDFRRLSGRADFYFVRHGESEANRSQVIQGRQNAPLSDGGRAHARAAGEWFSGKQIDSVYCSPLDRARETADILCRRAGFSAPKPDERIIELDTGLFSGLAYGEIKDRYPAEWNRFQAESWEGVPEAESIASLRARAFEFWQYLISEANEGMRSTVTVSHAGMIQWLIKVTVGSARWMPLFAVSNCGIFHFTVQPVRAGTEGPDGREVAQDAVVTSRESRTEDLRSGRPVAAGTERNGEQVVSYFGEWRLMNLIPY